MFKFYKLSVFIVLILGSGTFSYSQTYTNLPNDTVNMTGTMEDLSILTIQQLNISGNTIQLKWQKISESVPAAWDAAVCDNVFCYTSLLDSGMMNPVAPNDFGLLLMHVTPHVNFGTAVIQYSVWDIANPSLRDTLTYILSVYDPTAINESVSNINLHIFPNPAREFINILPNFSDNFEYVITDISGRVVLNGNLTPDNHLVSTTNLTNGLYFVFINQDGMISGNYRFIIQQ